MALGGGVIVPGEVLVQLSDHPVGGDGADGGLLQVLIGAEGAGGVDVIPGLHKVSCIRHGRSFPG